MDKYEKKFEVRWADLDPNFHVLHSRYYDFGAYCRMSFMFENGLTPAVLMQHDLGPVLFSEQAQFKKEIRFGDDMRINIIATESKKDFSRWSMAHEIYAGENLSAVITVSGAWMSISKRKLATPPDLVHQVFATIPKSTSFKFLD